VKPSARDITIKEEGIHLDSDGRCYLIGNEHQARLARKEDGANLPSDVPVIDYSTLAPGRRIALAGNLASFDNAFEILGFLAGARRTGSITFWGGRAQHSIDLNGGRLVGASTSARGDRIGQILYRMGALSDADLTQQSQAARKAGRPLGNYLVNSERIQPQQLLSALKQQLKDIILSIVSLDAGDFVFTVETSSASSPLLELDVNPALMEALQRLDELRSVEARFDGPRQLKLQRAALMPSSARTSPVLLDLLDALAEPCTLAELCERVTHSRRAVLEGLYEGFQRNYIGTSEPTVAPAIMAPVTKPVMDQRGIDERVLQPFQSLLKHLYSSVGQSGDPHAGQRTLKGFQQFYGYTSLFKGVRIDENGLIDIKSLKINLQTVDVTPNHMLYAARALDDLVTFSTLALRTRLKPAERRRFTANAKTLLRAAEQ